jgi:superfamily I DNA/RNA helicase
MRTRLLEEVIRPYIEWKTRERAMDWNDLALRLAETQGGPPYDVVIVDEAQDFSANQVRGVVRQLAATHSTTFVLDSLQQIYPRGFTWREAGIEQTQIASHRLVSNFRNTREIASFARPLVEGIDRYDEDVPADPDTCERSGPKPQLLIGRFERQMDSIIEKLDSIPAEESVALLHPKGGGFFDYTRQRLGQAGIQWVELTRRSEWPAGAVNVALSTLHSAKGLEFDHVVILGLNAELLPHGEESNDTQLDNHRRLVAMAAARARETLTLSYKPGEESAVVSFLRAGTYETIELDP